MATLAMDIRLYEGIWVNRDSAPISHLFCVDNAMFFFNASTDSRSTISNLLTRFCGIL